MNLASILQTPGAADTLGDYLLTHLLGTDKGHQIEGQVLPLLEQVSGGSMSTHDVGAAALKALTQFAEENKAKIENIEDAGINKTPGDETLHHSERVIAHEATDTAFTELETLAGNALGVKPAPPM